MTDDTDPQTERLLNRIEAQQERIDDLEETVQQMLPSRRQVLAGAGIAGASALTGGALTGGASAAPQGQIGTSSTPVGTIYADTLDVDTAKYDQVDVDTNLAVNSFHTDVALSGNLTGEENNSDAVYWAKAPDSGVVLDMAINNNQGTLSERKTKIRGLSDDGSSKLGTFAWEYRDGEGGAADQSFYMQTSDDFKKWLEAKGNGAVPEIVFPGSSKFTVRANDRVNFKTDEIRMHTSPPSDSGTVTRLISHSSQNGILRWADEQGNGKYQFTHDDNNNFVLRNLENSKDLINYIDAADIIELGGWTSGTPVRGHIPVYSGITSGDLTQGECAFDSNNNRLVFADNTGTEHYWNTDGTL